MQSFFLWVIISGFSCFCQFFFLCTWMLSYFLVRARSIETKLKMSGEYIGASNSFSSSFQALADVNKLIWPGQLVIVVCLEFNYFISHNYIWRGFTYRYTSFVMLHRWGSLVNIWSGVLFIFLFIESGPLQMGFILELMIYHILGARLSTSEWSSYIRIFLFVC